MRISDWSSDVCASDLLMMMPDMLLVENYRTMHQLGLVDSIAGIALPYMASGFGIFLLRQAFKTVPGELEEAARLEGCGALGVLWRVYVPLARPVYLAHGLVSVSYHWNNFLLPQNGRASWRERGCP